jgi:hypothetical protein
MTAYLQETATKVGILNFGVVPEAISIRITPLSSGEGEGGLGSK